MTANAPQNIEIAIRPILIAAETEGYNGLTFTGQPGADQLSNHADRSAGPVRCSVGLSSSRAAAVLLKELVVPSEPEIEPITVRTGDDRRKPERANAETL